MLADILSLLFQITFFVNIIFAAIIVFLERKNPAVTWAWLMVVLIFPYIGFIVYLILGMEPKKHKTFFEKSQEDEIILKNYALLDINKDTLIKKQRSLMNKKNVMDITGTAHLNDLVYLNLMSGNALYTCNNSIDIFHEGNSKFEAMLKDIKNAKSFIHLQYYIVRNSDISKRLIEALSEKALEGVEVKLLIDGMGSLATPKKLYEPLIEAGGKLGIFLPPYFVRINYRNHRKICVIDGLYGYVGGLNIGDEYLGKSKRFGNWRDCHIRIEGDGVHSLETRFIMDWNYYAPHAKVEVKSIYFPSVKRPKDVSMQIVSSGPDTKWPAIHDSFIKMISEANKSIYIQTPYFVPDDTILESLRIAALSGIDIRIMIPAHPDHPFVYWAALSYLGELLDAGVKCYQYENGFVHSKLVMIDSLIASVGTANLDIRSFKLNFEITAFIYDSDKTKALEKQFLEDMNHCTQIDSEYYKNRSTMTKIKEAVSRLLSPLL